MDISIGTTSEGAMLFKFEGTIDETVDFSPIMPRLDGLEVNIDLYGIRRINSVGVKKWMIFFEDLQAKKIKAQFHRVSPAIVEQLNLVSNFHCGGTVVTAVLPFICKSCGEANYFVRSKEDITDLDLEKVEWPCHACRSIQIEFDDIVEDYLKFWMG